MSPTVTVKNVLCRKWFIAVIWLFCSFSLAAQHIQNVHFEQEGKMINIYYDLIGDNTAEKHTIEVYCSTDGGTNWGQPLQKVTGNIGTNQSAGNNKKITWDVLAEREKLEGNVVFEVRVSKVEPVTGTFTDARDGLVYKWVKIGEQFWMAENLAYLQVVSPPSSKSKTSPYFYVYNYYGGNISTAKTTNNYKTYGVLYNWPAATQSCPNGWHLPSDAEWTYLTDYLGGKSIAGNKLKESGYNHWSSPNAGATNENRFTALPGGYRIGNGSFEDIGNCGYWWSAMEDDDARAWSLYVTYGSAKVVRYDYYKDFGFSVRCVRDY